jgi:hypothetical protein
MVFYPIQNRLDVESTRRRVGLWTRDVTHTMQLEKRPETNS